MANNWGGRRVGAGRRKGTPGTEIIPKISVPEHARRYTHRAITLLASTMSEGFMTRWDTANGQRIRIREPASVALRVHCAELLLERGHGKPHQAIAVADGSTENKTLRDLILGAMALPTHSDTLTIDHEPVEDSVGNAEPLEDGIADPEPIETPPNQSHT